MAVLSARHGARVACAAIRNRTAPGWFGTASSPAGRGAVTAPTRSDRNLRKPARPHIRSRN